MRVVALEQLRVERVEIGRIDLLQLAPAEDGGSGDRFDESFIASVASFCRRPKTGTSLAASRGSRCIRLTAFGKFCCMTFACRFPNDSSDRSSICSGVSPVHVATISTERSSVSCWQNV